MNEENELAPGQTFAGCSIEGKIGQGGMGSVYKARHMSLDKEVCIKILAKHLAADQRNVEFFLREARSAAKLEHPSIVQIYNFGHENGLYYIIMSYIEGESLEDIIKRKGPLSVEDATDIIISILKGLEHAHEKTIIHRDIKPSNILIDKTGRPKIVDFGLARSINEEKQLTIAGEMVGTAYFMSPEQGLAAKVDNRADLYSVGATFFYLLTGKYPFDGETSIEVIHKHISAPLPNIFLLLPEAPIWVPKMLQKLMSKKPDDRYQTAAEVIAKLEKYKNPDEVKRLYNNERTIEMPGVESRVGPGEEDAPTSPMDAAQPKKPEKTDSGQTPDLLEQIKIPEPEFHKPQTQLRYLPNLIKTALHLCLTAVSLSLFLMAGSLPSAADSISFSAPLRENPAKAALLAAISLGLLAWGVYLKPRKISFFHTFCLLVTVLSAYAAGALALTPGNLDMISKTVFILKSALENTFAANNLLPYAVFSLLLAFLFSMRSNLALKAAGVLFAFVSVICACKFLQISVESVRPDSMAAILIIAAFLLGAAVAFAKKEYNLLVNPPLFFVVAHVFVAFSLAGPQIQVLTEKKRSEDMLRVAKERREATLKYQQELMYEIPEYDENGKPIVKETENPADKIKPRPLPELKMEATAQFYSKILFSFKEISLKTGGFLVIGFLFFFLSNIVFADEIFNYRRGDFS